MTLFEEGRFRIIDPVARYVPSLAGLKVLQADGTLADQKRPVMVRDVMAHTSGLSYHCGYAGRMYAGSKLMNPKVPLAEAIDDLASYPLAFEPGCDGTTASRLRPWLAPSRSTWLRPARRIRLGRRGEDALLGRSGGTGRRCIHGTVDVEVRSARRSARARLWRNR